jgi:hypothetical protein
VLGVTYGVFGVPESVLLSTQFFFEKVLDVPFTYKSYFNKKVLDGFA